MLSTHQQTNVQFMIISLLICTNRGESGFAANISKMLLELHRILLTNEAVLLRTMAWNPSVRASANICDALQKRGSLNRALNPLLY